MNFDLFKLYLEKELYLNKIQSIIITNITKKYYKEKRTIKELEEYLEKLGFYDITINNISQYLLFSNYRYEMDRKLVKFQNV